MKPNPDEPRIPAFRPESAVLVVCLAAIAGLLLQMAGRLFDQPMLQTAGMWLNKPLRLFGLFLVSALLLGFLGRFFSVAAPASESHELAKAKKDERGNAEEG